MAFRNIDKFVKSHTNSNGGTVIVNNYGNSSTSGDEVNVLNVTSNNVDTYHLNAKNADIINANIYYLMADDGVINKLSGEELQYTYGGIDNLSSKVIETDKLKVKDEATINKLIATDINSTNIITDYLTVNKSAHFFELIIDKIRSVQGTQINTAANCIVDYVEAYQYGTPNDIKIDNLEDVQDIDYYRIYWRCEDDGREVKNEWLPLDLALCESFSVNTGATYDVGNKYYWRKVISTDEGNKKYINFNTGQIGSTKPATYEIIFSDFSFNSPALISTFNDFTVTPQGTGLWDDNNNTWTCTSTNYGLQLTHYTTVDSPADQNLLGYGTFSFTTSEKTLLNIGVYYDDGSVQYLPADIYKTNYSITTEQNKVFEAIVINSAAIDKWELCNWIDLSNSDMDAPKASKSSIPSIGDNVCQLGYRYDELGDPTQDDISRASAIIIAAYATPDSGITPPSYAQYKDIGTNPLHRWDLGYYRHSYFDADNAYFEGSFAVNAAGQTMSLDDYINDKVNNNPVRVSIQNNGYDFDLCVLQCQKDQLGNLYIDGMNNFPTSIDLKLSGYSDPRYINVLSATLSLFGRTLNLIDIYSHQASDTAQGIYVSSVTMPGVDYIHITFGYRGSAAQQIDNGTALSFAGQFKVGEDQGGTIVYTDYSVTKSVSIAAVTTAQGANGELWLLNKECEILHVNNLKKYEGLLRYGIQHIIGQTGTTGVPTTQKLRITTYDTTNTPILPIEELDASDWDSVNNRWEWSPEVINNWYDANPRPQYVKVEFIDANDNILDTSIINVMIDTTALFTVEEGLTQSIQGVTNDLNDEVNTRQTQYSSIAQTVNGISSTVASHTTNINDMQYNISQIDQDYDSISLQVRELNGDVNDIESGLQTTGINITNGTITLDAAKTDVTGNFNIGGNFESYNALYKNRTIINTNSSHNQGLVMRGPNSIDASTGLPKPDATETDLIRLDFQVSAGAQSGEMTLYSRSDANNYMQINSQEIKLNNSNGSIDIGLGGIDYSSLGTQYERTWEELFCNKLRTNYIDTGAKYTVVDSDMITDIFLVDVSGDFGFYLPFPGPAWDGKRFYIKKINSSGNLRLVTTDRDGNEDSNLLDGNSASPESSHSYDKYSVTVICAGNYWIVFRGDD